MAFSFGKSYYPVSQINDDRIGTWMNLCTTKDSIYAIINHKDSCYIKVLHSKDTGFNQSHCNNGVFLQNPKAIDLKLLKISNDTLVFIHDSTFITILKSEIDGVCSEPSIEYEKRAIKRSLGGFATYYIGTSFSHHISALIYHDSMLTRTHSNSFAVQFGYISSTYAKYNLGSFFVFSPGIDIQYSNKDVFYLHAPIFTCLEMVTFGYSFSYTHSNYYNGGYGEFNTKNILTMLLSLVLPKHIIFNNNDMIRFTLEPIVRSNIYYNYYKPNIDIEFGILFRYYFPGSYI